MTPSFDPHTTPADVAIVGAGAAGLATAIFAGRARRGLRIVALDGAAQLGAKILVAGGGRCNVTNVCVTPQDYYGGNPHLLRRVLAAFPADRTRAFFEELGVGLHEEEYGKLFPHSNRARTVLDALLREAQRLGVILLTRHRVRSVRPAARGFALEIDVGGPSTWQRKTLIARRVVLATGGLSLPKTGSDGAGYGFARTLGHSVTPTTPALDPLLLAGDLHAELSGIAHEVELTFRPADGKPTRIAGPLLWTHFGISGPAALNVSRFCNRARSADLPFSLTASFLDTADFQAAEQRLLECSRGQPRTALHNVLAQWLPARLAAALPTALQLPGQSPLAQVTRDMRRRLAHALTAWPLPVIGSRGYKYAEVTAGGVPLTEIDAATMASRLCPGLYLVGELLDVDGRIGGFNFQWAWSSGWVAGHAVAEP